MPLKVEDIDWSPLQVMTAILRKHAVKHVIIGGVALLHYQVIPTLDEGFVTEICIDDNDIPQAEGIFSTSQIFRPVRACCTMDPYIRFQSTWSVTPRTIIFLPSSCFFDDSCIQEYPEHIERPGASFPYTCTGLDPLLFPDPHGLLVSLVNRRVAIRDTLSGQAAKRLFDAGILDLPWIKSLQWSLQQHEVSMSLINERCDRDHDECGFRNTRDSTAIIRQTSADGSVQVKIEDEDTN